MRHRGIAFTHFSTRPRPTASSARRSSRPSTRRGEESDSRRIMRRPVIARLWPASIRPAPPSTTRSPPRTRDRCSRACRDVSERSFSARARCAGNNSQVALKSRSVADSVTLASALFDGGLGFLRFANAPASLRELFAPMWYVRRRVSLLETAGHQGRLVETHRDLLGARRANRDIEILKLPSKFLHAVARPERTLF
jgi:hypothetical protein